MLDDFERGLKVETADRNYAKGVELIHQRMSETLKKLGLEPIESEGRKFDPNLHQVRWSACPRMRRRTGWKIRTILGEFQRGYNLFKGETPAAGHGARRGEIVKYQWHQ